MSQNMERKSNEDRCSSCVELSQLLNNTATKNNININSSKNLPLALHKLRSYCGSKMTILHAVCMINNLQLVKLFVEDGADVNAQTSNLYSPMHVLLNQCEADPNIVNYLISHGADVKLTNYLSETLLHCALRAACMPRISSTMKYSPNVNASAICNVTSSTNAASAKSIEIIDILLASGADPGESVIRYYISDIKVFKRLLKKTDLAGIDKNEGIKSLLDFIMWKDDLDCLEILLNGNCSKEFCVGRNWKYYSEYTKISWIGYLLNVDSPLLCLFESWKEMLHLMLKYGLFINSESPKCVPPLCVATHIPSILGKLKPEIMYITELIHCGADVNYPDALAPEALLNSCRCENSNVMLLLLKHSDYATPDSVINGYVKVDEVSKIAPNVIELFLRLGMTQSSMKLLNSHITAVSDYNVLTGHICTLEQLSRIAVRHLFYSKQSKSSVNEIMKKLPHTICKYIKYETEQSDEPDEGL